MKKLDFVMDLTDALSSLVENVQEDAKSFEDILINVKKQYGG